MEKSVPKKAHIYLKGFLSTIEVQLRSDLELYQIEIIYQRRTYILFIGSVDPELIF